MLKKVFGSKLSRAQGARMALFRSLIKALVERGQIVTTKAKAKAIRSEVDKIMTKVRRGTISDRRRLISFFANDRNLVRTLFSKYTEIAKIRNSGFTRTIQLPSRRGDGAQMARLEWVDKPKEKKVKKIKKEVKKK